MEAKIERINFYIFIEMKNCTLASEIRENGWLLGENRRENVLSSWLLQRKAKDDRSSSEDQERSALKRTLEDNWRRKPSISLSYRYLYLIYLGIKKVFSPEEVGVPREVEFLSNILW